MVSRREAIVSGAAALLAGAAPAVASQAGIGADRDFAQDNEFISAQRATDGRLDLNAAPVGDYMQFPGMYPAAAGKIASNGPYDSVCKMMIHYCGRSASHCSQHPVFLTTTLLLSFLSHESRFRTFTRLTA